MKAFTHARVRTRYGVDGEDLVILITGASGNVGAELVKILIARGVPFRAMVRSPEAAQRVEALAGVEIVARDFNDTATTREPLAESTGGSS
jgi:nucleoside-diphosphate-sugar epimerase